MDIKTYKRNFDHSYTLGAFPTFELLDARPESVISVFADPGFTDIEKLEKVCLEKKVPFSANAKVVGKLSDKGNVYVTALFKKHVDRLDPKAPHVVLVNPSDMGNLGTIIRTAAGFGILDLAVIEPAADIFNPKTVRASMGALFRIRHRCYSSFANYMEDAGFEADREIFTFMLNGEKQLYVGDCPKPKLYSLVFGNEATGLPDEFLKLGQSVIIPQSGLVDSLNLTIAAGIGMFMFSSEKNA